PMAPPIRVPLNGHLPIFSGLSLFFISNYLD
ncbi:MAG: hypothetical protein ACI9CZ_001640, partial [Flavobacterium sp.]